jgi:hypothetical protein
MAIPLNDNLHIGAGKPADDKYLQLDLTPYPTTAAVLSRIPISERYRGQTFLVLTEEYWFQNNLTTLEAKGSGGGLGYTAEDVANKAVTFSVLDDTLYPTVLATNNRIVEIAWNLIGLNALLGDVTIDSANSFGVEFLNTTMFNVIGEDFQFNDSASANRYFRIGLNALGIGYPSAILSVEPGELILISNGTTEMTIADNLWSLAMPSGNGLVYSSDNWTIDLGGASAAFNILLDFDQGSWVFDITNGVVQTLPLTITMASPDSDVTNFLRLTKTKSGINPVEGFGIGILFDQESGTGSTGDTARINTYQTGSSLGSNIHLDFHVGYGGMYHMLRMSPGFGSRELKFFPFDEDNFSNGELFITDDRDINHVNYLEFTETTTQPITNRTIYYDDNEDDFVVVSDGNFVNLTKVKYKAVTGTTYTILESDRGKLLGCENAGGCTVTIPTGLSVGHAVNVFRRNGAGATVLSSAGTLEGPGTTLNVAKTGASIVHIGSNIHVAQGALS